MVAQIERICDTVKGGMGFMGTETLAHKAELQQKTASEVWIHALRTISKSRPETIRLLPEVLFLRISLKDIKGGGQHQIRQRQRNKCLSFWRGIFRNWKLHFPHVSEVLGETEVPTAFSWTFLLRVLFFGFLFSAFSLDELLFSLWRHGWLDLRVRVGV